MKRTPREKYVLDSSFLIAALEEERPYAKEALNVLILKANASGADLMIAATVEAEMRAGDPNFKRPPKVSVIAFGTVAADKLATVLAESHIKPAEQRRGYWKFDAITLAVALAAEAEHLVHEDDDFEILVKRHTVTAVREIRSEEARDGETGRLLAKDRRAKEREVAQQEKERKTREERERKDKEAADRKAHVEKMKATHARNPKPKAPPANGG